MQFTEIKDFNDNSTIKKENIEKFLNNVSLINFYASQVPPSFAWLKKDKFFWRQEEEWKEYMKMIEN